MKHLESIASSQRDYFQTGATLSLESRIKALKTLKHMIESSGDILADAIGRDLGRCWLESWSSEPGLALADTRYVLRNISAWYREKSPKPSAVLLPGRIREIREPFGTALIIGPWNYPAGLLLCPMVSALAAGNTVILKPSERAPETAAALGKLMGRSFPAELVTVVRGGGDEARWLIRNAADLVCFTGSGATGRKVMADAASRPIPVILELGGANPCFVADDADMRQAARRITWGKFFGAGQTCLAPNHVFVTKRRREPFLSEMIASISDFYGPDPSRSGDYGRIIDSAAFDRLVPMLSQGDAVAGGDCSREDLYVAPTLLTGIGRDSALLREEIFGPVLPVVECESIDEEIESTGSGNDSPLAAYGFSRNSAEMEKKLLKHVRAGSITVNGTLHRIVSSSMGFGGTGGSGFGRYRGILGFMNFTWQRIVVRKNSRLEMPMIYPPYRIARRFVRMLTRFF